MFVYVLDRWPSLTPVEANQLISLGISAYNAGQAIAGGDVNAVPQISTIPVSEWIDDGDFQGSREQVAVEITIPGQDGAPDHPYLVIVGATGTETLSELLAIALADLCQRARDSPGAFPDVDCTNVLVFDYEILSTIRAF